MKTFRLAAHAAALFIAVLTIWAGTAQAQQPTQPSAGAIAAARELIVIQGAAPLYESIVPDVIAQARNGFLQSNPMLEKDLDATAAALRTELEPKGQEILNDIARLYATRFTEQELKEAQAFYQTPVGKKMLAEEPQLIDKSMAFARAWANRFLGVVIAQFRAEMKKRGHDM
jgi:hypothetical protein